jgi:hypothetical protein
MHTYRDAIRRMGTVWVLYANNDEKPPLFHSVTASHSFDAGVGYRTDQVIEKLIGGIPIGDTGQH